MGKNGLSRGVGILGQAADILKTGQGPAKKGTGATRIQGYRPRREKFQENSWDQRKKSETEKGGGTPRGG